MTSGATIRAYATPTASLSSRSAWAPGATNRQQTRDSPGASAAKPAEAKTLRDPGIRGEKARVADVVQLNAERPRVCLQEVEPHREAGSHRVINISWHQPGD